MALVLALGTLGVGYAMWSDTVTISGDVNTGSVDIEINNASYDEVYKNLDTGALKYHHVVVLPGNPKPPRLDPLIYLLVGYTDATRVDENTLTISYNNIFPIPGQGWQGKGYWLTDLTLHNNGTVPVKLKETMVVTGNIPLDWIITGTDSIVPVPGLPLEGYQLEPCESISCFIGIIFPDQPPDNVGMGLSGTITLTLDGVQWNEY